MDLRKEPHPFQTWLWLVWVFKWAFCVMKAVDKTIDDSIHRSAIRSDPLLSSLVGEFCQTSSPSLVESNNPIRFESHSCPDGTRTFWAAV
eukprot:2252209-Amphidinium_carterae.1